jgi:hypothetical protein
VLSCKNAFFDRLIDVVIGLSQYFARPKSMIHRIVIVNRRVALPWVSQSYHCGHVFLSHSKRDCPSSHTHTVSRATMSKVSGGCVLCGTTDPKVALVAAVCSHRMCSPCIQMQLLKGPFDCPLCATKLSRVSFRQTVNTESFQQEAKTRKRLAKILNRTRADFDSDQAFYDYEEWAEDITYNIVHNIDRDANEAKLQAFIQANQTAIIERNKEMEIRNRTRLQELQAEQALSDQRHAEMAREAAELARERRKERENVLSKVQLGQVGASSLEQQLEVGLKRRLKKKLALENAAGLPMAPQQQQGAKALELT